ncbi:TPA: hypothetical protein ACOTGN_002350 [Clostridium perfringens]|uniref:hypothetical protein n=1 Tax=Clostridium perfringens TaxID=1502 RepID=UPI000F51C987|nr:hypothetical protein [Clostridium perfringens]MDK3223788.1 hypothetical protein [Clostridium perfringens]MDM0584886.1 hypothetical protein [Clostridium perfringens]MDM0751948.1 hypothetical protein [Clostridium perfringens]MDM0958250.1 hypothetical protein [Clostridium perfringens]RQN15970.1 hypothetical protein EHZ12_14500 [Clostridium perfringens]
MKKSKRIVADIEKRLENIESEDRALLILLEDNLESLFYIQKQINKEQEANNFDLESYNKLIKLHNIKQNAILSILDRLEFESEEELY